MQKMSSKAECEIVSKKVYSKSNIFSARMNQFLRYLEFLKFKKDIENFNPDIIITQQECVFLGALLSNKLSCNHIFFVRGVGLTINKLGFGGSRLLSKLLNLIFEKFTNKILSYSFNKTDLIISNSHFIGNKFENRWSMQTEAIYPFVHKENFLTETTGEKILHVSPSVSKGIDITLKVAEEIDKNFIIVGKNPKKDILEKMNSLPNVEYLGYKSEMKEVYSQTGIAIVPSKLEEAFGRIPIEAGFNGIPSVCSGRGGLPESVGNNELCIYSNKPGDYINKINEIESNYEEYSKKASENSENKKSKNQIRKFYKIVEDQLDINLI